MAANDKPTPTISTEGQQVGALAPSDTVHTEDELMDRAVEEARRIPPPPEPTGPQANPVVGATSSRPNPGADTTVPQAFENLAGEDDPGSSQR